MKKYKFDYHKVASAMITNYPLLNAIAKTKVKTIISTGMSSEKEVEKAVNIFKKINVNFHYYIVYQLILPQNKILI